MIDIDFQDFKKIFEAKKHKGKTYKQIVDWLKKKGFKTERGNEFVYSNVENYIRQSGIDKSRFKIVGAGSGGKYEDLAQIKKATDALKKFVERKNGYKVLNITQNKMLEAIRANTDLLRKDNIIKVKNNIMKELGWINPNQYKNEIIVKVFVDEHTDKGCFDGKEKFSDKLLEFRSKHPDHIFEEINRIFRKWAEGVFEVEGVNRYSLKKQTLKDLKNWSPTMKQERGLNE